MAKKKRAPRKKKVFKFYKNKKLGDDIDSFSIDREYSCRGASRVCREICYGGWNRQAWTLSLIRYLICYTQSLSPHFAEDMIASLEGRHPVAFRIDDVGDLYSIYYIIKWLKIVRARRDIMFFAFTRMWTSPEPELVLALRLLAAEPNMTLILSLDKSMPYNRIPRELAHLPRAWLSVNDNDIPPPHLHIAPVFRNLRLELPPLEDLDHFRAMVCPPETKRGGKKNCRVCEYCWLLAKQRQTGGKAGGRREVAADTPTGCTAGTGLTVLEMRPQSCNRACSGCPTNQPRG